MPLEENAVVRLSVNGLYGAESFTNVLHFRVKAVAGVAAPEVGLAIIASAWGNAWDGEQCNQTQWVSWQALQVRGTGVTYSPTTGKPSGGQTFEGVISPPIIGDAATDPLPPSVAIVASLRSGISGKSRRGRSYIPGASEGASTAGSPTSAAVTSFQAALDGFLATYKVGGGNPDWELGVWSYRIATDRFVNPLNPKETLFGGSPSPATAYVGVVSGKIDPQWGSMRSRSLIS
jgi:hypothetical protein